MDNCDWIEHEARALYMLWLGLDPKDFKGWPSVEAHRWWLEQTKPVKP